MIFYHNKKKSASNIMTSNYNLSGCSQTQNAKRKMKELRCNYKCDGNNDFCRGDSRIARSYYQYTLERTLREASLQGMLPYINTPTNSNLNINIKSCRRKPPPHVDFILKLFHFAVMLSHLNYG